MSFRKVVTPHGFTTVDPIPSSEELAAFYRDVYYQQQASATYQAEYSDAELAQKRLRANLVIHSVLAAGARPGGEFFEVGCGEGFMLEAARSVGFDVAGIDFSSFGVEKFHPQFLPKVMIGDAFSLLDEQIADARQVDVCVLQNVLEHVPDPGGLLQRIGRILKEDGLAVITVPNDYSRVQKKLTELGFIDREYWFVPPQHLQYFNIENLKRFVGAFNYDVVDAYGDFPIELFLFHPGSNYVLDRSLGGKAHAARLELDLLLSEQGLGPYHKFCQAMTSCGIGRNVSLVLRPNS